MLPPIQRDYLLSPAVIPADTRATVRICPRFSHAAFPPADRLTVELIPVDGLSKEGYLSSSAGALSSFSLLKDGTLEVTGFFAGEQEHTLLVKFPKNNAERVLSFSLYSLSRDLFSLFPYKGDLHLHSNRSDGTEAPEYLPARCREVGYDFMAVTDHRLYDPSREAIRFWKEYAPPVTILPGEEVQLADEYLHTLSLGAAFGIHRWAEEHPVPFENELDSIRGEFRKASLPFDPEPLVRAEWVFRKIREAGGVSVFSHPCWRREKNKIHEGLLRALLRQSGFDALEVFSGHGHDGWLANSLQELLYHGMEPDRRPAPVSASDAHGTSGLSQCFRWNYTIVFASSPSVEHLVSAIRKKLCVAVEAHEEAYPRITGEMRLVRYGGFLMKNYFPYHDFLAGAEGAAMHRILAGAPSPAPTPDPVLSSGKNDSENYRKQFFRRG
ncbi:MAG: DNA polymerase/3'-5' exonuclease PolX [Lentisphaerae bacterium ADurb.Bin242]|nr:MAG: DNA polymerase/3'-5' exonuclease PolX [Lentisphaerae bacterium ADurb.Bin242]